VLTDFTLPCNPSDLTVLHSDEVSFLPLNEQSKMKQAAVSNIDLIAFIYKLLGDETIIGNNTKILNKWE
jgi:hypothetical protein